MPPQDPPPEEAASPRGRPPAKRGFPTPFPPNRPTTGAVLKLVAVALIVGLLWVYWDHEAFLKWKEDAGPVPFFLALAILPAVGVPTTPFYLLAGATFPLPLAMGGSLAALVANLLICYAISKGPLRRVVVRWLERGDYELPDLREKGAWRFSLLVKFMPGVPAFVKNYLLGLAGVPFAIYLSVSIFASGIYIASFVVLGESAMDRDPAKAIAAAAVLLLGGGAVWWLRRRKKDEKES